MDFAVKAVDRSLEVAGCQGGRKALLEEGIIEIVLSAINGNPRLFMKYLAGLGKWAYLHSSKKLTLQILKSYLVDIYGDAVQNNWETIKKTRKFEIEG